MKKQLLFLLMAAVTAGNVFSQTPKVFERWVSTVGSQTFTMRNAAIEDASSNTYVCGATTTGAGDRDILVQKLDVNGKTLWTRQFGGAGDDFATNLYVDDTGNVYLTGIYFDTINKAITMKYSSNGLERWHKLFIGSSVGSGGSDLVVDDSGYVYVCGANIQPLDSPSGDLILIKYGAGGLQKWVSYWNNTTFNLSDAAAKCGLDYGGKYVEINGITQTGANDYKLMMVNIDKNNGAIGPTFVSTGSNALGLEQITSFTKDNSGNSYLAGSYKFAVEGQDFVIIKLDTALNVLWTQTYSGADHLDDICTGIVYDANYDWLYITGYETSSTTGKDYKTFQIDPATGGLNWHAEFNDSLNYDDAANSIAVDIDGNVYVTGTSRKSMADNFDFHTIKYAGDGTEIWKKASDGNHGVDIASNILVDNATGAVIVSGQSETAPNVFTYRTIKYIENTKVPDYGTITQVTDSASGSSYLQSAIIVKFDRSALNMDMIDERGLICSQASTFLSDTMIYMMGRKLFDSPEADVNTALMGNTVCKKIFEGMSSADSLSMTRSGEIIRVPDFWTTLLFFFSERVDEVKALDSLRSLFPYVIYAQPDYVFGFQSTPPNDPLFGEQASLMPDSAFANGDINVQPAWDIWDTTASRVSVKIGDFDSGIDSLHPDLTVFEKRDFTNADSSGSDAHGTAVAGIIGAKRNNNIAVAGIAGSTGTATDTIFKIIDCDISDNLFIYTDYAAQGFIFGASNIYFNHNLFVLTPYHGFALNVMNNSWGGTIQDPSRTLINEDSLPGWPEVFPQCPLCHEAVAYAFRNGCSVVASRGNGYGLVPQSNYMFPSCEKDEFVLNIGASGTDGEWKQASNTGAGEIDDYHSMIGKGVDLIAPGCRALVRTTRVQYGSPADTLYKTFSGTSAAAPHVTGTVALMMSIVNSPCPSDKNLSPEDVEYVLERTATAISSNSTQAGAGRLNAGRAMEMLQGPQYQIMHVKDSASTYTSTQISSHTGVRFSSPYSPPAYGWPYSYLNDNLDTASYFADIYKVTKRIYATDYLSNNFSSNLQVLALWPRNSASTGWALDTCIGINIPPSNPYLTYIGDSIDVSTNLEMDTTVVTFNGTGNGYVDISAYIYYITSKTVYDTLNPGAGDIVNDWYPCAANQLKFNYSVYVYDPDATTLYYPCDTTLSVYEHSPLNTEMQITGVYPNPSIDRITVEYNLDKDDNAIIYVYDIMGRKMFSTPVESRNKGTYKTTIDVSNYSHGVYFVSLNSNRRKSVKKFVILK